MKIKKIIALALAILTVASSFASCADTDEGGDTTTVGETAADAATEAETEDPLKDNLPEDLNFGDDTITILSREREGWTAGEIWVESQNGDIVNDAVYERNKVVEDRLGINIENVQKTGDGADEVIEEIRLAVSSKTGDYDMVAAASCAASTASLTNIFADLRSADYIDFEQPWWSQGYNEAIEYDGKQFSVTGPICLSTYRFAFVTLFNKQLFDNAVIEYPYAKVRDFKWTLDYQMSLVPLMAKDDGDGEKEIETDVYGFTTSDYISVDSYWSACDIKILEKDLESGEYKYVLDVDKLYEVTDKILELFYGDEASTYIHEFQLHDLDQNEVRKMFSNGQAGMATMRLMEVEISDMRNMENDYGVLPMPMYDENQQKYQTMLHDQFTVMCVPSTVVGDELDKMGAVLEAMAVEGARYITPAYYETALRYKHLSDPDSWEMLTIISDGIYMDAGVIYTGALDGVHGKLRGVVGSENNSVSSTYKSLKRTLSGKLKTLNKQLSEAGSTAE